MRLYLDQMFRSAVAETLRADGHDAVRASEASQARADDSDIMSRVIAEGRILVTLDEHFGDWAILPLRGHPGVIRLKVHPTTTANVLALLRPFLLNRKQEEFVNRLVIVSGRRVRWITTA